MSTLQNRRSRATDERIAEKVYEVMIRDGAPIEKITVRRICELAGINRSTFYAHFQDVYDVMEQAEKQMSRQLTQRFLSMLESGGSMEQCFCAMLQFVGENRQFYAYYLNEASRTASVGVAWELLEDKIAAVDWRELGCKNERELALRGEYFVAGVTAVIRCWLNSSCPETPRELARLLARQYRFEQAVFE